MTEFDVDAFLCQPLTARVATVGRGGPAVRPVWFLWEDGCFWWLTGSWSRLEGQLGVDPRVALVVDVCDLASGQVRQVTASGRAQVCDYDAERAVRTLRRYLGPDEGTWDAARFDPRDMDDRTRFVRLRPQRLVARDLSYRPSPAAPG